MVFIIADMVPYQKKEIKMKYIMKILLLTALATSSHQQYALDTVITFYLQKYPYFKSPSNDQESLERFSKKVQQPDFVTKKIIKTHKRRTGVPGVMCMYAGHVALSDEKGQVVFPRTSPQEPKINFLITKGIKPAYMIAPATVHNWQLDPAHPAHMYQIRLKQNEATELYYFEAMPTSLPKDNNIPINTIIIIAEPKNIFIPQGATITDYSPNLTLPNVYIKREFCFVYNSFYTLAIKQYFEQTAASFKHEELTISMIQQPRNG